MNSVIGGKVLLGLLGLDGRQGSRHTFYFVQMLRQ